MTKTSLNSSVVCCTSLDGKTTAADPFHILFTHAFLFGEFCLHFQPQKGFSVPRENWDTQEDANIYRVYLIVDSVSQRLFIESAFILFVTNAYATRQILFTVQDNTRRPDKGIHTVLAGSQTHQDLRKAKRKSTVHPRLYKSRILRSKKPCDIRP